MKRVFVTGATGLVGYNIVQSLLKRSRRVRVLVRSAEKAKNLLPKGVEIVQGDILDKEGLTNAMNGCAVVYHAAGLPEQWFRDSKIFYQINVQGTQNIIDAVEKNGVHKLIYTSTIDVFKGNTGERFNESIVDLNPKGTAYERSKQQAFQIITEAAEKGLPVISVHPAGVYGPGPAGSPGVNNFISDLKNGKVPMLLPGGLPLVFSEDVGEGHVLAEEKGTIGQSYILSEDYYTLPDLAAIILCALRTNKKVPVVIPLPVVRLVSNLGEWIANLTGKPPLIPKGQLHFMLWGALPDSTKARVKLDWKAIPLPQGIRRTVGYLFPDF